MECGDDLSYRTVARQVLSALQSLTSVFEMRTGGSFALLPPQWLYNPYSYGIYTYLQSLTIDNCIEFVFSNLFVLSADFSLFANFVLRLFSTFVVNKPSTY